MPSKNDSEGSQGAIPGIDAPTVLTVIGLQKAFPGVQAIKDASFELRRGEIHALVGENGAGKSTLIKVLTGVHTPDSGEVRLHGRPVRFDSPIDAHKAGIAAIYQEFTLVPSLSIGANLFLGQEDTRKGFLRSGDESVRAREALSRLGVTLDPSARVSGLSVSEQQLVEIARALVTKADILIMDEPTAALAPREVSRLVTILKGLVCQGMSIIFISHRLDEVLEISDRITVMRDGSTIATAAAQSVSRRQLIELMVGRPLEEEFPKVPATFGPVLLEVRGLSGGKVREVNFSVKAGEVLGIGGLMGAGRTELARLIFGADKKESGEIHLDGQRLSISSPRDAIQAGICLLTEDRKQQGLVLGASAKDNFSLPNLTKWTRFGLIKEREEARQFAKHVGALNIRISSPHQRAESLSGGNQQKLLVARWLETDSQVIIFDEPTRGIDVGAKYEMYLLINKLAALGKAIILISSELPELLGMSDRIIVMREGHLSGEIVSVRCASQEQVMALAV